MKILKNIKKILAVSKKKMQEKERHELNFFKNKQTNRLFIIIRV